MKTFTIELLKGETNFLMRAEYEFGQHLREYLREIKEKNGLPLTENFAIFSTMMTKTEGEDLKKAQNDDALKALETLQKSVKKGDPSEA